VNALAPDRAGENSTRPVRPITDQKKTRKKPQETTPVMTDMAAEPVDRVFEKTKRRTLTTGNETGPAIVSICNRRYTRLSNFVFF
jgi:hypothetical protein